MLLVTIHYRLLSLVRHQSDFRAFVHTDTGSTYRYTQLVVHFPGSKEIPITTFALSRGERRTDGVTGFELIQTQVEASAVMLTSTPRAPGQIDIFQQRRRDSHFSPLPHGLHRRSPEPIIA